MKRKIKFTLIGLAIFILGLFLGHATSPNSSILKSVGDLERLNQWYQKQLSSQLDQTRKICDDAKFFTQQIQKFSPSYPTYKCDEKKIGVPTSTLEFLP